MSCCSPAPQKFRLHIEDPPRRKHMVFLGGSVLGDIMATRDDFWMWRKDYEELGVDRLYSRFFERSTAPAKK